MQPQEPQKPQSTPGSPPNALPRPQAKVFNDIMGMQKPPQRPANQPTSAPQQDSKQPHVTHPGDHMLEAPHEPLLEDGRDLPPPKKKRSKLKIMLWSLLVLTVLAVVAAVSALFWYQQQLQPAQPGSSKHVRLTIEAGSSPSMIGAKLKESGLIRNTTAFSIYTKLSNTENDLKAGVYNLKPSESLQQIVDHLVSGKQDTFSITFLPGDTLANNRKKLIEVGYSSQEVDTALNKKYERPLFAGKPASADLEGYIYGETYEFDSTASVETILGRTFDEYEKVITANKLSEGLKKQGFTLYQGITLASIIQREVRGEEDERQVARVFLNRIKAGMTLGSDVTYQYAAKKMGVDPHPGLDSPYNTRIHTGLPPGPIASPGVGALKAVANPGTNDYLFFLSGDDDVTYFGKTDAEHQKNIVNHCQKKCLIN